jgi:beta-phosphoglucomutase
MDGVVTNTMPDHYHAWRATLKDEGICVTYEDIYKREGQPGLSSVQEIFRDYAKDFDRQSAARILRRKEVLFKKIVRTRFISGARTFLKELRKKNIRLALVTGTSRHELHRILPAAVRSFFSVIVTGNDVTHGKPHPEPYLRSLKSLNIGPSQAVVIENAPFGILSAKKAGLKCLALETSLPRKYLNEADFVFSSIKELQDRTQFLAHQNSGKGRSS